MSDAPMMFFELLKQNLESVGFEQYKHIDPCLFIHKKAICLTYVDDCLWFGRDAAALDAVIQAMKDERKMDLTVGALMSQPSLESNLPGRVTPLN